MTIDRAIQLLQEAKQKLGGDSVLFVNEEDSKIKWDETMVVRIVAVDDGESRYVKLVTQGRG